MVGATETAGTLSGERQLHATVPACVERALKIKAAEEGTTIRTLVLRGLQAIGVEVPPEEIGDRRKR
jgi:hypothetical protein